ncbi:MULTISPECIES: hypothetical protein [Pseudonocardia]|uniref:Lipoprotein LprG n=2 Tax=Pseudonocardia TaxID=1847 RepID=A0A1Y2N613_PSEAH|nr:MULTISPECIES: hypothetical protein [Pseudonocardia]OSY42547.1 hypothetical protein BG845_01469 [Pseudonocardia autotrophica]TDN76066.1 hypothetical protein C8E95_5254 [Pseudonocardia autotrophica]BBG00044.1 hypothetical protein Pdca_12530 [Pseudonocardia autotrophica]GEC28085.1 hypothetical protein PSA01_51140 [Pseudonocardia saturnea]
MIRGSRASLVVLGAVLAVLLAGCTGGDSAAGPDPSPTPQDVVTGAGTALVEAGTARVTVTLDGPTGPLSGGGPVRFDPFAADLTVALGTRGAHVRVLDDDAWLRLGGAEQWQRVSTDLLPIGALSGALHATSGLRDVTEQGPEDVNGVPAVRYAGTVDLTAARDAAPGSAEATRLDELAGLVSPNPGFGAWIGAPGTEQDGRLLQLRLEPAEAATGTVTLTFAEPGLPVDVTAP